MRSLYRRQLTMMVSIMLLSFTLLAGAFMLLSYRYIIGETRDSVERNAGYVSSFTSTYYRRSPWTFRTSFTAAMWPPSP